MLRDSDEVNHAKVDAADAVPVLSLPKCEESGRHRVDIVYDKIPIQFFASGVGVYCPLSIVVHFLLHVLYVLTVP